MNVSNAISAAVSFSNHKSILLFVIVAPEYVPRELNTPGNLGSSDSCLKINRLAAECELDVGDLSFEILRQAKRQEATILPIPLEL